MKVDKKSKLSYNFSMKKYINNIKFITLYLALHRIFPRSKNPEIRLLPKLAFWSITIGVAASVLILSLANGLHNTYISKLAEQDAHISVISVGEGIPVYETLITKIQKIPGIVRAYPYSQNEALLRTDFETTGIVLKSLPEEFSKVESFTNLFRLVRGTWSLEESRSITIGEALARNFSLFIGDFVDIMIYDEMLGAITYRFRISGVFSAGDALINTGLAFINNTDALELFGTPGYTQYIGINVENFQQVELYAKEIQKIIPFGLKTWRSANLTSLLAIQNEKQIIKVLLLTFFCVAFFGILAVITVLVADKKEEIILLKALGLSPQKNFNSFLWMGLFLGFGSSLVGTILGIIISLQFNNFIGVLEWIINSILFLAGIFSQQQFSSFRFLNQSVYYLNSFPILINGMDIIFVGCSATLCALLASLYPAHLSKELRPAEILRKKVG